MTDRTIGPLRRRMTEDMTVRGFTAGTQQGYIRAVQDFTAFLGRPPDRTDAEELRRYQLYMRSAGVSATAMNAAVSALRFFFGVTLGREDAQTGMTTVREPRKLPVVPSPEEITRLLDAAPGLEYRAALSVAYGAGLRASEVVSLKLSDIDSGRMVIRVEQGKGRKDRYAMLPPALLDLLRAWWLAARERGVMLPGGWLFPGQNPVNPLTTRQLRRAFHGAKEAAGIDKQVSLHGLRHCFATHLLEHKVGIRVIPVLLGHKKLDTTARYSQVASTTLRAVESPLEHLSQGPLPPPPDPAAAWRVARSRSRTSTTRPATEKGRQTATITPPRRAKEAGPRRRPRHRSARGHPELPVRPARPAGATAKSSQFHPAVLAAGQILAIQKATLRPPATLPPSNPHRPNHSNRRA